MCNFATVHELQSHYKQQGREYLAKATRPRKPSESASQLKREIHATTAEITETHRQIAAIEREAKTGIPAGPANAPRTLHRDDSIAQAVEERYPRDCGRQQRIADEQADATLPDDRGQNHRKAEAITSAHHPGQPRHAQPIRIEQSGFTRPASKRRGGQ